MNMSYRGLPVVFLALAMSGCKEPNPQPSVATPAPETAAAPSASLAVKPTDAGAKLPPGPLSVRVVNGDCNVESVNGTLYSDASPIEADRSKPVRVQGWAVDKETMKPAVDVALVVEKIDLSKRWEVAGMPALSRQDVADYNKFPSELVNSGFSVDLDLSAFEPGLYHMFIMRSVGQERISCDNSRQITLR